MKGQQHEGRKRMSRAGIFGRVMASAVFLVWAHAAAAEQLSEAQLAVTPSVILAGELRPGALEHLAPGSVVIDLRVPEATTPSAVEVVPGVAEEAAEAARLGLDHRNVPVAGAAFTEAQLDEVAAILAEAGERTVVVHCATGNRAAMIWGALALRQGAPLADVMDTVAPVATRQPVRDALADYAEALAGERSPD
jgi:protein tyrosine phosphatase (PTP) superfamily phosphohydrolase (DUF442 family)